MIQKATPLRQWLWAVDRVHDRVEAPHARGHPYVYAPTVILRCYLLMLVYPRVRKHAALHRFLCHHRWVRVWVGLSRVPHRTTLSRRFKALEAELRARIRAMGLTFILAGYVQVHVLMADGTLHQAAGPSWPAEYQKRGELPAKLRHVDRHAGWGKSSYHGWVWGYRTHPVVALTPDLEPIPIVADARPAQVQDNTILAEQLSDLPAEATVLLLDSSYEDHALVTAWERQDGAGVLTRWMVIDPKRRPGEPAAWRQHMQVRRFIEEGALYALRSKLIEPFFAHWKQAFELDRLPLQGRDAPVYLLLALYGYQLLIWTNWQAGRPTYAYQPLILGCP